MQERQNRETERRRPDVESARPTEEGFMQVENHDNTQTEKSTRELTLDNIIEAYKTNIKNGINCCLAFKGNMVRLVLENKNPAGLTGVVKIQREHSQA